MALPNKNKPTEEKVGRDNLVVFCSAAGFNDMGEEMYAPSLPLYAANTLNVSAGEYGLIEGIAEAFNRILRFFTGGLSDLWGRKIPVVLGYMLSAFSRLGLPLVQGWLGLMSLRAMRGIGRALRDPAREASIAESIAEKKRGKAFGLLNTVDTIGAVLGPIIGLVLLTWGTDGQIGLRFTGSFVTSAYQWLFIWAAIPTVLSCWLLYLFLTETHSRKPLASEAGMRIYFQQLFSNLKSYFSNKPLRMVTLAHMVLALGVIPISMILYYVYTQLGANDIQGRFLFMAYALIHCLASYPAGVAVDYFGRYPTQIFAGGIVVLALVLMVLTPHPMLILIPLVLYAVFEAIWIAARRALIADLVPDYMRGQVLGTFSMLYGLSALMAPILVGFFWQAFGPGMAFILMAIICGSGTVLFWQIHKKYPLVTQ